MHDLANEISMGKWSSARMLPKQKVLVDTQHHLLEMNSQIISTNPDLNTRL